MAVLVSASWFIQSLRLKTILRTSIPLIVLLIVPFLMSPFSKSLGVRTISDIQGDDGLYVAYSWEDFSSNFISFKNFFGRLWILTEHVGKPFNALWFGVVIGAVVTYLRATPTPASAGCSPSYKVEKDAISSPRMRGGEVGSLIALISYIFIVFIFAIIIRNSSQEQAYLVQLFALLAGIGIMAAFFQNPKRSIPIVLMILVQIIAITAILPKTRYYLPVIPFVAMAIAGGVYALAGGKYSRQKVFGSLLLMCCMVSFVYTDAQEALSGQVSEYNEKSAGQTVLLSAARYMKDASGAVAAVADSDLQFRTYLPRKKIVIFPDSLRNTDEQYAALKESGAVFISETTENPYFAKLVSEKPELFQEVATFQTRWADVSATLYRVY